MGTFNGNVMIKIAPLIDKGHILIKTPCWKKRLSKREIRATTCTCINRVLSTSDYIN